MKLNKNIVMKEKSINIIHKMFVQEAVLNSICLYWETWELLLLVQIWVLLSNNIMYVRKRLHLFHLVMMSILFQSNKLKKPVNLLLMILSLKHLSLILTKDLNSK